MGSAFLPERLRPSTPRRRSQRRLLWSALVPALVLLVAPAWRVLKVEMAGDFPFPPAVTRSLAALAGTPVALLDLEWVRAEVESWPGVASVEVALELPATLKVAATREAAEGSIPVGRGWHGVAADGGLAGSLAAPQRPLLQGFAPRADELLTGLEVARRLERASGARVESVRRVTPADYRVSLRAGDIGPEVVVHVLPRPTEAERFWCLKVRGGPCPAVTVDLRSERRLVMTLTTASGETTSSELEPDGASGGGPA